MNTDGSFTMADLNSFLSPYKILPIAEEIYLGILGEIFLFYHEIVSWRQYKWVYTTHNFGVEYKKKYFPKLSPLLPDGAMINPQWPMSQTKIHGPKDVRANELWLYVHWLYIVSAHRNHNFCYFAPKHLWVLIRIVSMMGFLWVPATYDLMRK